MRGSLLAGIVTLVAALHVAVVSLVFGPRHVGYLLSAALSATLIWGVVYVLSERRRRAGLIAGVVIGLAMQQVAYWVWKMQLPGFWWPLAQFGALQFLVVYVLIHTAVRQLPGKPIRVDSDKQAQSAAGADNKK